MIIVTPCAKINLGLNITERRPDGYHNLETIFYPIPIFDVITIKEQEQNSAPLSLKIEGNKILGNPADNLIAKAYNILHNKYDLPPVEIALKKNIPTQAGMGGGSADCAYTLSALNEMFHIGLSNNELCSIATKLGADCPFFINSSPCYAEGIGEIMSPISISLDRYWIMIVKPDIYVSTKEAFGGITPQRPEVCCKDIVKMPLEEWKDKLVNDFEKTIFKIHPRLREIKEELYRSGAIYASMSGSGSALYGIFRDKPQTIPAKDCRIEILRMRGAMERFPIVDDYGKTIGQTTRAFAHGGEKPLHPVVHLHIFNSNGDLYLQKRPMWKDVQPGKWDTAVGGHVDYGEKTIDALKRESREEVGIKDFTPKSMGSYVYESNIEKEYINVFSIVYDGVLNPSSEELDEGRFFSKDEICHNIGKGLFTPNFESEWLKYFGNGQDKKEK